MPLRNIHINFRRPLSMLTECISGVSASKVWLFSLAFFLFATGASAVPKALVIGMATTSAAQKCWSCRRDASGMQQLLQDVGYDVTLLIDEQATRSTVIAELSALANESEPGSLTTIFFSGHGGQKADTNSDEADGFDETWVVYDGQILDDEIGQIWSEFSQDARVFFISDSCNSGSTYKDANEAGMIKAIPPSDEDVAKVDQMLVDNGFRTPFPVKAKEIPAIKCTVISLAGCEDGKPSHMGSPYSCLTDAIIRYWDKGMYSGTYQAFIDLVSPDVKAKWTDQVPQIHIWGNNDAVFPATVPFRNTPATYGVKILPGNVVDISDVVPKVPNSGTVFSEIDKDHVVFKTKNDQEITLPRELLEGVKQTGTQGISATGVDFAR